MVAVILSVFQTLQQYNPGTAAEEGAAGIGVEWPTRTIRGHHAAFQMLIATLLRKCDRNAPRQRHVGFEQQQALAGFRHGHQGRGAGGLQRQARTFQIELIRYPRGQKILP